MLKDGMRMPNSRVGRYLLDSTVVQMDQKNLMQTRTSSGSLLAAPLQPGAVTSTMAASTLGYGVPQFFLKNH